jgi:hypothetical protein
MNGRTLSRVWSETANGENNLQGGEGNSANGAYIYTLHQLGIYKDAVGAADNNINVIYQTFFNDYGWPNRRKYVRNIELDHNNYTGTATVDIVDISGNVATSLPINAITR